MNIFVGSLSFKTTEQELQNEFKAFGEVDSVKIVVDRETLKSRGFAFVTMPDQEQATAAIAGLNGKEINGFALKVNEARPRDARGPSRESRGDTNRGGGSGYGSESRSAGYGHNTGGNRFGWVNSNNKDSDIYDGKAGPSGGGRSRKGRGDGSRGTGGRPSGGRRSF